MFCTHAIKPDIIKSHKKYKEIKELSDFVEELESNGSNVYFNTKEILLIPNSEGYKGPFDKTFNLVTDKQKRYECEFNYCNLEEKRSKKQQYSDPKTIFGQAALHLKVKLKKKLTT